MESIVCDSLDYHLVTNELIHSNQWGFKKGVSTESLLLYLTEAWKKAIDDGYKVGVLFVDFKKAFDTVDHAILKDKLSDVGVSGVFHEWIASYLHERFQYVTVNGVRSKLQQIDIGVPQGSLLGPRLFTIYVICGHIAHVTKLRHMRVIKYFQNGGKGMLLKLQRDLQWFETRL